MFVNNHYEPIFIMHDFRLLLWIRRELLSSGLLHSK